MTLAASGYIRMGGTDANRSVNIELGRSSTATTSFTESAVRTLTGVASGPVTLPTNFWNKPASVSISYTFTTSTANASLNVTSISGYVAGASNITVTVNSGVYLYSTSVGNAGLTLTGGTSGDTITLVNNGYIMGKGGNGAVWDNMGSLVSAATAGSNALSLGFNATVTNTSGYIGGGGGSGGGVQVSPGAGGAGGGDGGIYQTYAIGGAGGGIGASGANGVYLSGGGGPPGGGGRILPGTGGAGGTVTASNTESPGFGGGAGGGGGAYWINPKGLEFSGAAGGGGGWGASGGSQYENPTSGSTTSGGSGGSAGAAGGDGTGTGGSLTVAGTAGGKAVALNGYAITWTGGSSSSSRAYGAVS